MDLLTANDQLGEYPRSYYAETTTPLDRFPKAQGKMTCDVCVVGAGFTGMSAAYHLAQSGYDVVVVDAQRVGFGASGRNGGQVSVGQRREQDELEAKLGDTHAKQLWDIGGQAVDLVRDLCKTPDVHTNFNDGIIEAAHRKRDVPGYHAYAAHLATKYDHDSIRPLSQDECRHLVNSPAYYGGTLDTKAGHVNPLELVLGLTRLAVKAGARVFEQSRVTRIVESDPATVQTDSASITARYVVLACNGYLGNLQPRVAQRVMPINNFIVATKPMSPDAQADVIRNNYAVADGKFVVNYFRFSDDHRLLFGGTESYGYTFPADIAAAVRRPLKEIFPQLADIGIDYAWGGTLAITMNRLPHFERIGGHILTMSGYSGAGVAMGTLAGQIAADAIAGQAERFDIMAKIPNPQFPGGAHLRKPLLALAMLWYTLRDKL